MSRNSNTIAQQRKAIAKQRKAASKAARKQSRSTTDHENRHAMYAFGAVGLVLVAGIASCNVLTSGDSNNSADRKPTPTGSPSAAPSSAPTSKPLSKKIVLTSAMTTVPAVCADPNNFTWFADIVHNQETGVHSNFFGPPVIQTDPEAVYKEMVRRRCLDPSLAAGHAKFYKIDGYADLTTEQLRVRSNELQKDHSAWLQLVNDIAKDETGKTFSLDTLSGSYQTEYAVFRQDGAPEIRATNPDRPSFIVLTVGDRRFKLDCGFQPTAQSFPGIQPLKPTSTTLPKPKPSNSTPPGTPTTTPPTSKPPTTPPTSPPTTPPTVPPTVPPTTPPTVPPPTAPPTGKHASQMPPITSEHPVVTAPGGYVDPTDGVHPSTVYTPPAYTPPPGQQPGQGGSGPGAIPTYAPPSTEAPAPAPASTNATTNPEPF